MSKEEYTWNYALHYVRQSVERGIKRAKLFTGLASIPWRLDINTTSEDPFESHRAAIKMALNTLNLLLDERALS